MEERFGVLLPSEYVARFFRERFKRCLLRLELVELAPDSPGVERRSQADEPDRDLYLLRVEIVRQAKRPSVGFKLLAVFVVILGIPVRLPVDYQIRIAVLEYRVDEAREYNLLVRLYEPAEGHPEDRKSTRLNSSQ